MKSFGRKEIVLVEGRFLLASLSILVLTSLLIVRLWYVQVYRGQHYAEISERNRVRRIEIAAPRGVIYDRYGTTVLGNRPFFDLVYVPQFALDRRQTFKVLERLLHIPVSSLERRMRMAYGQPKYLRVILKRNLSVHEVSVIESNKAFLPGVEIHTAPRREYKPGVPAHLVGYLGEINQKSLQSLNLSSGDNPYRIGDLIGKQGLEARWEAYLRGKRGFEYIQVDAFGRRAEQGNFKLTLPLVAAKPGNDIELTLDWQLQLATKDAFKGKYGAVVVLAAQTGEILAMLSSPGFDPTIYQEGLSREEWRSLVENPFKPLYDKTTGGEYPPGSIYKAVLAIAGLEEGVVTPQTTYFCPGYYVLGDQVFQCHHRPGHGKVNLRRALMKSCDVFFYEIGVLLGVDKIAQYARDLGLGEKLGIRLNTEKPGLVPTAAWKKLIHRVSWTAGDTPNVAIGQGYNLMTPIQMANLYATIANGGKIFRPYLMRRILTPFGEPLRIGSPDQIGAVSRISGRSFAMLRDMLQDVVMSPEGTGKNAAVPGVTVAGKTGSAQVVSLKKNRNQDDVSMKWKEHAIFAAFAPVENAEIALAIVSENDQIGGGGAQAAPVAGKIIKEYFRLKKLRQSGQKTVRERDVAMDERTEAPKTN